ncbi:LytR/AlgR family response regulator transcription factor [Aurantiacibacter gangjinensis]|uniref:Uncharacterized protein n=1 Tax=Aurantiacibacter gangjinensis TaxID=502682 RepID=A0A0G9MR75_9SPHN|nr:LytTR family DNA-binding domain-containing protein [Aurantiacibacter gangjinensis]APE27834.1 Response regulator receiver [Aurantiacibacter gangjinensis]KLE31813.1 hypothetical protein AAW01_10000 [Aurantiacibacter gangjinensis]
MDLTPIKDSKGEMRAMPSPFIWAWAGIATLFAVYLAVFLLTRPDGFSANLWRATYNVLPVVPLVFGFHALLQTQVWPRRLAIATTLQIPLALAFAFTWYLAIIVLRGLPSDWVQSGFEVRPFVPIALVWQLFQGVSLYAVVALASLAITLAQRAALVEMTSVEAAAPAAQTILLKTGNEHEAVDIVDIIRISGAGDYCEVHLQGRIVLSTTSLAQFEARLPESAFIRAHRSHIVRLGAISRSEPAGNGRTVLHLVDGSSITTSRAGSRALRESAA